MRWTHLLDNRFLEKLIKKLAVTFYLLFIIVF